MFPTHGPSHPHQTYGATLREEIILSSTQLENPEQHKGRCDSISGWEGNKKAVMQQEKADMRTTLEYILSDR